MIAIFALQGAFAEHQQMLQKLGAETMLIRNLDDWNDFIATDGKKGIVIPGGESTAMQKIMKDEGIFPHVQKALKEGMPAFGTCAGLIMLDRVHLDAMDIMAERNAYGRQLGSFCHTGEIKGMDTPYPMTFIRAPYIKEVGKDVEVLAVVDGRTVAARQGKMLACAFHPELTDDTRFHELFLNMI